MSAYFAKAEKQLDTGPFFKGETLSNIDIAWLPLLHRAHVIEKYAKYDFLAPYPRVKAWQAAIMATGLAEKSVAEDFDEAFTAFYLSESTYLGTGKCCTASADQACDSGQCC
ncbi:glutathione S-transferase family protein [Oceanospirillum beijerinckii]|uniref:glutathione S-transferase family protein n=1 Tax=Oceanospirillum beijerinckii TaxID=64976 RepID=UPI000403A650|nr:glutathione S-transferase domain-containing protein [Oceanospirillum beijerinckii]